MCSSSLLLLNSLGRLQFQSHPFTHPLRISSPHLQKRPVSQPQRATKVLAFHGLTAPPYKLNALEPYMSQRTLELHWGKHHQNCVESLNKQLVSNPLYGHTTDELIKVTYNNGNPLPEFNNAAQPIISLDMWEYAYYLDYKDDREIYATIFMNHLVSWHAATVLMARAEAFENLGEPNIPVA